jgi:hypothetical protein
MAIPTTPALPILLFGASTPSGAALRHLAAARELRVLGRRCPPDLAEQRFIPVDLTAPPPARLPLGGVIISFAPLWHLAPFLAGLLKTDRSMGSAGTDLPAAVVACSSSSVLTKRFAANAEDQALVRRLRQAETTLEESCQALAIPCRIIRPTLIYGEAGGYRDRNLSVLLKLMGRLPVLPLPSRTGLRQPIHARQLAAVSLLLADQPDRWPGPLTLGGDDTLTYAAMLERLRAEAWAINPRDPAGRCRLLPVPAALFHLLAAPLLPWKPKLFEAVLRIEADLAGFTTAHSLLQTPAERFPVHPLARG